jgi:hypothetical protein
MGGIDAGLTEQQFRETAGWIRTLRSGLRTLALALNTICDPTLWNNRRGKYKFQ